MIVIILKIKLYLIFKNHEMQQDVIIINIIIFYTFYYYSLILSAQTWDKYISELIDYYSPELYASKFETNESGHVYRQFNNVKFFNHKLNETYENEYLMHLDCNQSQFFINLNSYKLDEFENICSNNSTWFSLKKAKNEKNNRLNMFKINEGDVLKIGKIIIRIRKIKFESAKKISNKSLNIDVNDNKYELTSSFTSERFSNLREIGENSLLNYNLKNKDPNEIIPENENNNLKNINEEDKKENEVLSLNKTSVKKNSNKKISYITPEKVIIEENSKKKSTDFPQKCCRICYLEEEIETNPLIQPCLCSGSLRYIHLECLRHWIGTRNWTRVENNENCCIYLIKEVDCELCKNKLPDYIRHKNKLYKINEFKINYKNYLSFENLTLDKQKNKFIYVINLDNKKDIKIGRGHEANIILSDISVSRVHCILNVDNNNVYLEDNDAKYGTLVLVQTQKLNVFENVDLNLQIGRSYINCKIKKPFKLFRCCNNVEELANYNIYYKQNWKKIGMKKVMTVKTEVNDDEEKGKEFLLFNKENIDINKPTPKKNEEPTIEIDIGVDEDENFNKTNINISKYTFISNDNSKNLLLNSMNIRKIGIITPLKNSNSKAKIISRNFDLNGLNNSIGLLPMTHRTGKIFSNK